MENERTTKEGAEMITFGRTRSYSKIGLEDPMIRRRLSDSTEETRQNQSFQYKPPPPSPPPPPK